MFTHTLLCILGVSYSNSSYIILFLKTLTMCCATKQKHDFHCLKSGLIFSVEKVRFSKVVQKVTLFAPNSYTVRKVRLLQPRFKKTRCFDSLNPEFLEIGICS